MNIFVFVIGHGGRQTRHLSYLALHNWAFILFHFSFFLLILVFVATLPTTFITQLHPIQHTQRATQLICFTVTIFDTLTLKSWYRSVWFGVALPMSIYVLSLDNKTQQICVGCLNMSLCFYVHNKYLFSFRL